MIFTEIASIVWLISITPFGLIFWIIVGVLGLAIFASEWEESKKFRTCVKIIGAIILLAIIAFIAYMIYRAMQ